MLSLPSTLRARLPAQHFCIIRIPMSGIAMRTRLPEITSIMSCNFMSTHLERERSTLSVGAQLLTDYVEELWDSGSRKKTVELASPDELEAAFHANGCSLEVDGLPVSEASVLEACRLTLQYSVRTNHPRFFNQLYGRLEPVGLLGQWVTGATSANCHTFEVAPVYTMTEVHMLRKLANIIGYPEDADGLFVPGGSISNLYGMHLARFRAFPQVKTEGLWGCPPLVAFTSVHAHYSYQKGAHTLGLGTNNLVKVATNSRGQLCPDALEHAVQEAIAQGKKPFFVGATQGSTVLGAFDDLRALRRICDKHGMWLHSDACWGGAAILSGKDETRELMGGIDTTDSMAWNPHKLMGIPMQCSPFLTRHPGLLLDANKYGAAYLFQPDKKNTQYDVGDKTIQCGRLPDSFKLWLAWKHIGDQGWAKRVDQAINLASHMEKRMLQGEYKGRFQLVLPLQFTNLCFWYIPPSLGDLDPNDARKGSDVFASVHAVAPAIKGRMQSEGKAMIGFQSVPLDGDEPKPNFFRMVVAAAWSITEADIDATLADIDTLGTELFQ